MIPILIILAALIIDIGMMTNIKLKASGTTRIILNELYENRTQSNIELQVKELYQKNNIEISKIKIIGQEDYFQIELETMGPSIFGKIIGIHDYKIFLKKTARMKENRLEISKE